MKFHPLLIISLTTFLIKNGFKKKPRSPVVLMLEPLHLCNLSCVGCGRIREYKETLRDKLPLVECLKAIDESDTPVVSITGGEPLLYPEIEKLVKETVKRKKHIYLCTNGILLKDFLKKIEPSPYLNVNVSLDGMEMTHDRLRNSKGVFAQAVSAIKEAKKRGFRVVINTTFYHDTDPSEINGLFKLLSSLGVNGILVAPAFSYYKADDELFLSREKAIAKFRSLQIDSKKFPIINTPLYLDLLKGERKINCTPWGNPTRNVMGWKSPCYLITDRHYSTFEEMMEKTPWEKYGPGKDIRCRDCMMHCGYEPTVMFETGKSAKDILRLIKWNFS